MTAYANVDGETVIEGVVYVPNIGPWWADVVFEGEPDISGAVTLNLGTLALLGTVDDTHDGTFGEQRRTRIVAGGGGWGTLVEPLGYHSDSGVNAREIADDAARIAGEEIDAFSPANASIGIDYVRRAAPAMRVLEDAIGGVPWHVAYDGRTNVGARAIGEVPVEAYEVLDFNPRANLVTIAADDLAPIAIGLTLSQGLDAPVTAFEIEIRIGTDSSRTVVWGGGETVGRGRLARAFAGMVSALTEPARLFARYRFRVVQMSANRVELQAVAQIAGLPDVLPVSQKPGVAGAHAKLAGGGIVLVEFIEGNPALPVVSAYAGKDEEGHAPAELDFSVGTTLRLGSDAASQGVPFGDSLKSYIDGHAHSYIPDGTGVAALTSPPSSAPIFVLDPSPSPSSKVKVA